MPRSQRKFDIVSQFQGYRHREDITNLPPGIMIPGSQNVLTNVSDRVAIRKGYTLDGDSNTTISPILSSFDWETHLGTERHLRAWGSLLEYRYVDPDGIVNWRTLMSDTDSPYYNFTTFWNTDQLIEVMLFVNGQSEVNEWNGAITTIASNTASTITKEGTTTWEQEGFYSSGTLSVTIEGIDYVYTGGEDTLTLTGLSGLPTFPAGTVVHQTPITTANSDITGLNTSFQNDLIATRLNHIYYGSLISAEVYLSRVNDYMDCSFDTPRLVGDGGLFILDSTAVGFINQDDDLYASAGKSQWYKTNFVQTTNTINVADAAVTTVYEAFSFQRLKTTALQGAQSQGLITKIKNNIAFVSNEPALDILGKTAVQNGLTTSFLNDPTINYLSDPIRLDFDNYNFNDGNIMYFQYFTYVSVPQQGIVRVYNHEKQYWEAPLILPIARFSIIDGELYGHSYQVPETYKLFEGTNDNGNPIFAVASFSFQNFGTRANFKRFNEYYVEGYISSDTELMVQLKLELTGCGSMSTFIISGNDPDTVCLGSIGGSLGQESLGKRSLAGRGVSSTTDVLPPKFRYIKTGSGNDFYEMNVTFSSNEMDQTWELLAFGPEVTLSDHDNIKIKN